MNVTDAVAVTETFAFRNRRHGTLNIILDNTRDSLLTDFGRTTLKDRYLVGNETPQMLFGRVAAWFAKDREHAQRVYDYMSRLWFMPATPVLSNGGLDRGNPISCFLNAVPDSMQGIKEVWSENVDLASKGGGIGTYWGGVREKGAAINGAGQTSGIIPFIKVMDSQTLAVSQGSLRRGSAAVYLDIHHPEIEEFLDIRRPTGDANRRCLNIHHGVNIDDAFMEAVVKNGTYALRSPKDGKAVKEVNARALMQKLLLARLETGEPYMVFTDTVNRMRPPVYQALGLKVQQSNLCSEIALHTGIDYAGFERTAVCCLSSLNVETSDQWLWNEQFIKDCLYFLDEVIEDFIIRTNGVEGFTNARYSAQMERSIGLGLMGFHSYLQANGILFDGEDARTANLTITDWLREVGDKINIEAADELGMNPDSAQAVLRGHDIEPVRWSHWGSIAPTASISIICGGTSAGIEPIPANIYSAKTLSGTFSVRNQYLQQTFEAHAKRLLPPHLDVHAADEEARRDMISQWWESVTENMGSVQHLTFLSDHERALFRTAFEIPQDAIIRLAADRAKNVTQMASNNLFMKGGVDKGVLLKEHVRAWKLGVPSLYYLRSLSVQRAESITAEAGEITPPRAAHKIELVDRGPVAEEECEACQ